MKVNKILITSSNKNPTKESRQQTISDLSEMISKNELTLPLYQRDLSWTLDKCIDLFNYQLLGKSPISAISINVINNTNEHVPQVSFIDRELVENVSNNHYSVVDGQQRLTTNYKAYVNHEDFKNIVLDLGKGKFIKSDTEIKRNQIPVGILYNGNNEVLQKYISEHKELSSFDINGLLLQIRTKFMNYNYTINSASDLTEDEQIEWFEVLNNAGSRVSSIQMRFSKLKTKGLDIYKDYTNIYIRNVEEYGFDFFKPQKTTVSYPIAALNPAFEQIKNNNEQEEIVEHATNYAPIPSDTKENQLCNLNIDDFKKCIEMTLSSLNTVLNFIEESGLKDPDRIDYINYLIGYVVFNGEKSLKANSEKIKDWYNKVDFSNKSNSKRRGMYNQLLYL